jgi:hypothetical protein
VKRGTKKPKLIWDFSIDNTPTRPTLFLETGFLETGVEGKVAEMRKE